MKGSMGLADEECPFESVEESRPNLSLMQGVGKSYRRQYDRLV